MQVTVDIPDGIAAQARALGLSPQHFIEKLIAEQANREFQAPAGGGRELSLLEFDAALDAMTRHSARIPVLPDEAFRRESFYENHD